MIRHLYLLFFLLLAAAQLHAQCTSFAGTITLTDPNLCEGQDFQITASGNAVLDGNDVLAFVAYTGASPNNGTVLGSSTDGYFSFVPEYLNNATFSVAALVGNDDGFGGVDLSDTCLAVSPPVTVNYMAYPQVQTTGDTLQCDDFLAQLTATSDQSAVTYAWSGPNNFTSTQQNPVVGWYGEHCVTVTNVLGCFTTSCAVIIADDAAPWLDADSPVALTCLTGEAVLTATTDCQQCNYVWTGPGVTSGQGSLQVIVNQPGTYVIIISNPSNGCSTSDVVTVTPPTNSLALPPTLQIITNISCFSNNSGSIDITPVNGVDPLVYDWQGPAGFVANAQDITGLQAGTYTVSIVDAVGCVAVSTPFVITEPLPMVVDVASVNCGESSLLASVTGGVAPYAYLWQDGSTTAVITDPLPGIYTVTVVDAQGCSTIGTYNYAGSTNNLCGYIEGRLVLDSTVNCLSDTLEPGLENWIVYTLGSAQFYGLTDSSGYFRIPVEAGNYMLDVAVPSNLLWSVCTPMLQVGQVNAGDTVTLPDVPVQEILSCPLLDVSIATGLLRRCFANNYYYVNYCNNGTAPALDANIVLDMDPFLSIVSSTASYVDLGNNQYQFDLGDLAIGACGTFSLQVMVSCDAALGQTHCVQAVANPHDCIPVDPLWSGASLSLSSECTTDSVYFFIKNKGIGDMSADAEYIVIEDAVMRSMGTDLRLDAGDSMRIAVTANGATWRVEVTQEPLHPGESQPSLSVEGCSSTGAFSTGFVTQYSNDDEDRWIDIHCHQNIGAYDPNDKQGFPIGYGIQRYIRPGTDIEYLIRFQNTGTDTAFNIYILDTLSQWLDPSTIQLGASSHPYNFDIYENGILKFDFPNIMLPDSNVNEPLSHGFVQFRIAHREETPLETLIDNRAAIYFDFNEPVMTNTTEHRLALNFISVSSWELLRPGLKLDVAPNPSVDVARVTVNGLRGGEDLRLRVCDLQGQQVREVVGTGDVFEIQRGSMPAGVYMLVLFVDGVAAGSGKMVVH